MNRKSTENEGKFSKGRRRYENSERKTQREARRNFQSEEWGLKGKSPGLVIHHCFRGQD